MEESENIEPTESEMEGGKLKETYHKSDSNESGDKGPKIKKGKVDSLTIYEVTEGELEIIERGSPNSNLLNFGIALTTTALSFLTTLLTVTISDTRLFEVFTIITVVGLVGGIILLFLWYRTKSSVDEVFKKIRDRVRD